MKIIAIHENTIGAGGGFDQSLNAILQMQRLSINRFNFEVFTTHLNNVIFLERLGIKAVKIKISIYDRLISVISKNSFWLHLQVRLKLIGMLERKLIKHNCDIVYFTTPSNLCAVLQKLNYINTLWDICHREYPEFPEVRNFNTYHLREESYRFNLGSAIVTLTDSARLSDMATQYYAIDSKRLISMPFAPSPFIAKKHSVNSLEISNKYMLEGDYFYYPAQFWPHKNHIRILQALQILRDINAWTPNVVFTGKDYGNLSHLKKYISKNKLESQVRIIGFVPSEDIRGLYENAIAVVMPTYFGPTNLPPLEAWSLGVPLIYSSHLAEQAGEAALLVNPDSKDELADAMMQCNKLDVKKRLISAGYRRLAEIELQRTSAENKLCMLLHKYEVRMQCWEN
jgi:glycosyltransferase involved in cell wall biosynthesis